MSSPIDSQFSAPFEGPEKLLEVWFAPSAADVPDACTAPDARSGLRNVDRKIWEEMLDIVQCKILSAIRGEEMDAYLLSESSFFVFPHRLILKTCGTTLNLLGLPRILEIAAKEANLPSVYRCFYSRKSFMFPERQHGPHREWKHEVQYLDNIFHKGAAYTVGKVNGDHWLLYLTGPTERLPLPNSQNFPIRDLSCDFDDDDTPPDYTIEILMSELSPAAREPFFTPATEAIDSSDYALSLSQKLGISSIFPPELTTLDAYSFTPCGYSANALLKWGDDSASAHPPISGEGYYTIHVTPEAGWSYASFECNVPLSVVSNDSSCTGSVTPQSIPDLATLIQRVVSIFQPGRLTLTLFISSKDNNSAEEETGETAVEAAQRAFRGALMGLASPTKNDATPGIYKRTDKINYEFGGYDLAFASFELVGER
ncbi:S-adenosylmethionine decarboxylase [Pluteus cervinus]|uniref:S-adenosylmethionine decarboxylase n=1 Tax=Pluteus cervinus TaxID=181527 RepID=A0ACD3BAD0_9AGAR|nr:S-adenosylmethionine decarboxylase [Pluteus cervinus]